MQILGQERACMRRQTSRYCAPAAGRRDALFTQEIEHFYSTIESGQLQELLQRRAALHPIPWNKSSAQHPRVLQRLVTQPHVEQGKKDIRRKCTPCVTQAGDAEERGIRPDQRDDDRCRGENAGF